MISSISSSFPSTPKGGRSLHHGGFNFSNIGLAAEQSSSPSILSPRGSCVSGYQKSHNAEFIHHLIQQHLDLGSLSPSTPPTNNISKGRLSLCNNSSLHVGSNNNSTTSHPPLQPLSHQKSLPLSPSHQHFHRLMSGRQQVLLPPIEPSSPTNSSNNNISSVEGNSVGVMTSNKKPQPPQITLESPQSMIKEKLKMQLFDQKSRSPLNHSQSMGSLQLNTKQSVQHQSTPPLSARVHRVVGKEWDLDQPNSTPPNVSTTSWKSPNVAASWVAPQVNQTDSGIAPAKEKDCGITTSTQQQLGHRWNHRMDKKLKDLEFHYSGGPTRVCHMKYLNDPNTEVKLPFKIDVVEIMPATATEIVPVNNNNTKKQPREQKKKKSAKKIERKLAKSKLETQKALEAMERKREQLDFLHRLAARASTIED